MNCHECQKLTKLFIDDMLSQQQFPEYKLHIDSCSSCKDDLYTNYAIITALKEVNEGIDLSGNYAAEVEQKLFRFEKGVRKSRTLRIWRRVLATLIILFFTCVFSIMTPEEEKFAFLPEGEDSCFSLQFEGVPKHMDPVRKAIYQYNDEVIEGLRQISKSVQKENR